MKVPYYADDFGYSRPVDEAILELSRAQKIAGFSVIVNAKSFSAEVIESVRCVRENGVKVGIHLNLTETFDVADPDVQANKISFMRLFWLSKTEMKKTVSEQLDRFHSCFGFWPDYVDSHHHVHQWPRVSTAILEVLAANRELKDSFIRNTYYPLRFFPSNWNRYPFKFLLKVFAMSSIGFHFKRNLEKHEALTNNFFMGLNPFNADLCFKEIQEFYKKGLKDGEGIYMVHPALKAESNDLIGKYRLEEFRELKS